MINPLISYFNDGITDIHKPYTVSIKKLHSGIVSCEKWIEPTRKTREAYLKYGKTTPYKAIRNKLPYVTPDGVWSNRSTDKSSSRLITPSGLIQVDIDGLNADALEKTRQIMVADPHTLILFTSPSGAGLKSFIQCKIFSLSKGAVIEYYQKLDIKLDESTLHDKAACFVCHDSSAYLNLEAEPFTKTTPLLRKRTCKPVIVSGACSTVSESLAYCKKLIEVKAQEVASAPEHTGTTALNACSYRLGRFADAGLSREAAEDALRQAYFNRPYRRHSEAEFTKTFNGGFDAGKLKPLKVDKPSQFAKGAK